MRRMYIYELTGWPEFTMDLVRLTELLSETRHQQGRLVGRMEATGIRLQNEASVTAMTDEIVKSNEIEGEKLNEDQVRSSIARRMGIDIAGLDKPDRNVEGVVDITIDATKNFQQPLSRKRLYEWHAALFPYGRSGMRKIKTGAWRTGSDGPMQVVSGTIGREKIHFEAPSADRVPREMKKFLDWFNSEYRMDPFIKAAIAHLWFVTIHPFADGNGRLARTITDMQLARADNSSQRFYSMSAQIQKERNAYYGILESTQKGTPDITDWMEWFLNCLLNALQNSEKKLSLVFNKTKYWNFLNTKVLNERQRKALNYLLDEFQGNLTSSKYAKITNCSQDTAHRDITDLADKGILQKSESGGRSTKYVLNELVIIH